MNQKVDAAGEGEREQHLTPEQLSARYSVPLSSIYAWRTRRTGPRGIRVGKHLRYRLSDVITWEESQLESESA